MTVDLQDLTSGFIVTLTVKVSREISSDMIGIS
jgi:hypothetical protein